MGETTRKCWKCDVCGFEWIQRDPENPPKACPSRHCRTETWNSGGKRKKTGRKGKDQMVRDIRRMPWVTANGKEHHPLCSCLLCLQNIRPAVETKTDNRGMPGRRQAYSEKRKQAQGESLRLARESKRLRSQGVVVRECLATLPINTHVPNPETVDYVVRQGRV